VKAITPGLRKRAQQIKLLLLDVDGVLTDGGIFIDDRGVETKRFDVRDGQGITLLRRAGIEVGFITGRSSHIVRRRARELGVNLLYQRVRKKIEVYSRIKRNNGFADAQIAYMGDDLMDAAIMSHAGLAITVKDSWSGVKPLAHYVTRCRGGHGAVREVCELLLQAQDLWDGLVGADLPKRR
jgi:3-deoxy-D-manno-octulosonate 8-phosphate phosphatase (KDO 8-P phosphatase)